MVPARFPEKGTAEKVQILCRDNLPELLQPCSKLVRQSRASACRQVAAATAASGKAEMKALIFDCDGELFAA